MNLQLCLLWLLAASTTDAEHWLAFTRTGDGNAEIYLIQEDGTRLTRLTQNVGEDAQPTWAPNGERIAFVSDRDGRWSCEIRRSSEGRNR